VSNDAKGGGLGISGIAARTRANAMPWTAPALQRQRPRKGEKATVGETKRRRLRKRAQWGGRNIKTILNQPGPRIHHSPLNEIRPVPSLHQSFQAEGKKKKIRVAGRGRMIEMKRATQRRKGKEVTLSRKYRLRLSYPEASYFAIHAERSIVRFPA